MTEKCLIMPEIRGEGRYDYKRITRGIWGEMIELFCIFISVEVTQIYVYIETHRKKCLKLKNIHHHRKKNGRTHMKSLTVSYFYAVEHRLTFFTLNYVLFPF